MTQPNIIHTPENSPVYHETFIQPLIDEVLKENETCNIVAVTCDPTATRTIIETHPQTDKITVSTLENAAPSSADTAISIDTMTDQQATQLKAIYDALKPGAKCTISFTIPSKNQPYIHHHTKQGRTFSEQNLLVTINDREFHFPLTVVDSPENKSFINQPDAIQVLCEEIGFKIVKHQYYHYKSTDINDLIEADVYTLQKPLNTGLEQSLTEVHQQITDIINDEITEIPPVAFMEAIIDKMMDEVIDQYRNMGFEVKKPTFEYIDKPSISNADILAQVPVEKEITEQIQKIIGPYSYQHFYRAFNIEISKEAALEMAEGDKEKKATIQEKLIHNSPSEIIFYQPSRLNIAALRHVIAHELWHIIEKNHGILIEEGFIHEGTAEFAAMQVCQENSEFSIDDISTMESVIYRYVCSIVSMALEGIDNPVAQLINPDFRKWLSSTCKTNVLELIENIAKNTPYNLEQTKTGLRFSMENDSDFDQFIQDTTEENFIKIARKKGYKKFADELEHQDTSALIGFYRNLLTES